MQEIDYYKAIKDNESVRTLSQNNEYFSCSSSQLERAESSPKNSHPVDADSKSASKKSCERRKHDETASMGSHGIKKRTTKTHQNNHTNNNKMKTVLQIKSLAGVKKTKRSAAFWRIEKKRVVNFEFEKEVKN